MIAMDMHDLERLLSYGAGVHKVCSACGVAKSLGEFYFRLNGRWAGLPTSACKLCANKRAMAWNVANKARYNANKKVWRASRKEAGDNP